MSDDARRAILARRATFVATALAGISVACGKTTAEPHPCLKVGPASTETAPMPCLSVAWVIPDSGLNEDSRALVDAAAEAGTTDASVFDGGTTAKKAVPATKPPPPGPPPMVCLSPRLPDKK